jgi:hypothetical protein
MKREVIKAIRIMGIGTHELIIDFNLSVGIFNSIEWSKSDNKLWLHMFTIGDFQFSVEWSDLNKDDKSEIYVILRSILYN